MVKSKKDVSRGMLDDEGIISVSDASLVSEKSAHSSKAKWIAGLILVIFTALIWFFFGMKVIDIVPGKEGVFGKYFSGSSIPGDRVVATIEGQDLYLSDVRSFAAQTPQLAELPFDMIYPQLVQRLVNQKVILKAAENSDIEKDPAVQKTIKMAHDQIISNAYLSRQLEKMVTPEKLKDLYVQELKNFDRQEEIRARHILVPSQKEAEDLLVQLKAGADFEMLANKKSLDNQNQNGGDLGYFQKNMMIPEFGEAVFALKKGQLSKPIRTPFGWHIVLVEDRRLAAPPAFEEIQEELQQVFMERNVVDVVNQEREKMNVKILVPSLTPPAPVVVPEGKDMPQTSTDRTEEENSSSEQEKTETEAK